MGRYRIFFFFFLLMDMANTATANGKKSHGNCIQCVAGNFLRLKWLMHDPWNDKQMWWKDSWASTDCLEGLIHRPFQCQGACVTIEIFKYTDSGYQFDAVLKDCSDKLFAGNNEIPQNVEESYPDATYTTERSLHRIQYTFYRHSNNLNNESLIVQDLSKRMWYHKKIPMSLPTKCILILLAVLFGLGLLFLCYSLLKCWFKIPRCKSCRLKQNAVGHIELKATTPSRNMDPLNYNDRIADQDEMDDPLGLDGSFPFNLYQRTVRPPSAFSDLRRGLLRAPPFASDESISGTSRFFEYDFE